MEKQMTSDKTTPWYVLNSPEIGGPFKAFYEVCKNEGVLDKKTKELLMLSIASIFRCWDCTESHIKGALEAGASREEITEALLIAAAESAGSQLGWAKEICHKYLANSEKGDSRESADYHAEHLQETGL
jgi:AhpD family alkylhydroperoxidase